MSDGNGVPKGWRRERVSKLVTLVNGFAFKPSQWDKSGLPIIRIQNLNNPDAPFNHCGDTLPDKFLVHEGDLLFAWSGTPGTSFGAHIWRGGKAWLNQHIFRVIFDRESIDPRFLRLAINQNLDDYIRAAHGGAGLAHITKGKFEESELMIAPLPEQRRIVAKIEELFSDLDAGVAALERVRANLKRYRASVLKAAVEGRLTEQWRADHPDVEPAAVLLERILAERRTRWEADQLARVEAAGKKPPKGWKDKYAQPAAPDTSNLPALPKGWCWAALDQLGQLDRGRSRHRPRNAPHLYGGPYPFIQTGDVGAADQYIRSHDQSYSEAGLAQSRLWPAETLCITIAANIAETAILSYPACFPDSVVGVVFSPDTARVRYIEFFLRTVQGRLEAYAPATAQKNINNEVLRQVPIALPPVDEQDAIVAELERVLSVILDVEQTAAEGEHRSCRLRQCILKKAFEGKLLTPGCPVFEVQADRE